MPNLIDVLDAHGATISVATNDAIVGKLPAALGSGTSAGALSVVIASDQGAVPVSGTLAAVTSITNALPAGTNLIGKVGIDQTTPGTTNGVQVNAALPAGANAIGTVGVTALPALPAGSNTIGTVGNTTQGYSAILSITRPANVTAYPANSVISTALTFPNIGPSAGEIVITSVSIELDILALPTGMTNLRLYFYNVTPPSALAANTAWDLPAGDRAAFQGCGYVDLGTPVDLGSTLYVQTDNIAHSVRLSGTSLFAYLVTIGGFTPAANSEVYVVTLHAVSV